MIEGGGSAFPSHGDMGEVVQRGMSLRDYFAAFAMAGLYAGASPVKIEGEIVNGESQYALAAYKIADAMLIARESK